MTGYVMAATDAGGKRLGERVVATAPTLGEAAQLGDSHRMNYVSVRHGHDITLYGRDTTGTWSVLVADAPAAVVVEIRRQHDARCRPGPDWDDEAQVGFEYAPAPDSGYLLTAVGVDGEPFGERVSPTAPTPTEAAELGGRHGSDYVIAGRDDSDVVTLYGRDAGGSWSVIAADVDVDTAEEMCLWFDLTQHYRGRSPAGHHPLDDVPAPEDGRMAAPQAISLVVAEVRSRDLDHPTQGLTADRFAAGWSVYAPVDVDDSDPMAFLDIPVGRSVFLVSDAGRVKEISSAIPPQQAEALFTAEEAYVRRQLAEERFMADLRGEVMRLDSASGRSAGIGSFTVDGPSQEVIATRASRLVGPIAQQLALLGPPGWDHFTAVFSCTVSGEVTRLRFRSGKRSTEARVPERTAVLVRRQRHLAARMPAGPWWRLLLTVSHSPGTGARMTTDYDYGDQPFPEEDLLAPEHYRNDLAAYPRTHTPAWLSAYAAGAGRPGRATTPTAPQASTGAAGRPSSPRQDRTAIPPERPAQPGPVPVLDTRIGRKRLYADPHEITYGKKSIALDQVEWVGYAATHTATKRFLYPTTHDSTWDFVVGRYPYHGGPSVRVGFYRTGRRAEQPEEWAFLVNLVRQYVEPRLLAESVARVRRGETVTVGGGVKVDQAGIACAKPRLALPWGSLHSSQLNGGMICVYQRGSEKPVLTVPLSHPNAALIPDLFAALTS
ncbi:hypothetical protein [Streptomyces palmae]|uniref:Uncharacterized protein n=1 Tax=Streptomyces palmae TaxID=1701085 RepID=A0A4Z0HHG1_9ACTN|nr:hypothetical protein [Streptomyces palmae]TGB17697.1 hypothetical protein E4099_03105 [Streptomyces palmae]